MACKPERYFWSRFKAEPGLEFFHHSLAETRYVYKEIFEDRVYFRHGITLRKGDCVFDVGANIGLFTLFVQEHFEDIVVHAFEPCPEIFSILEANVARYRDKVVAYPLGISDKAGQATFTFYPLYSIMSGFASSDEQDMETLRAGVRSMWRERFPDQIDIEQRFLDRFVDRALGQKETRICQLRRLSDIIRESGVKEIGLLKIDAEASELKVLQGIAEHDWSCIRQIAMEIHGPEAPDEVKQLMEKRGFQCIFDQERRLSGSGIVNCYASRR
jgi:FkbM family methyltransferase